MEPRLFLIPSDLGDPNSKRLFPPENSEIINGLHFYIVENIRSARRFLRSIGFTANFENIRFFELNKHTPVLEREKMIEPLLAGKSMGLISEAGVPAIADPGAEIILQVHQNNLQVIPLVGPSSILLALMASGCNGQRFCFNGYLPIKSPSRIQSLKVLEKRSKQFDETQIFMETPYRNQKLLDDIVTHCQPDTLLCIATDITLSTEFIQTKLIGDWKKNLPELHKRPCIFLIYAGNQSN